MLPTARAGRHVRASAVHPGRDSFHLSLNKTTQPAAAGDNTKACLPSYSQRCGGMRCTSLNNRRVTALAPVHAGACVLPTRLFFPDHFPAELVRLVLAFLDDVSRYKVGATCTTMRAAAIGGASRPHWVARMRSDTRVREWTGQPLKPCDCADCRSRRSTRGGTTKSMHATHSLNGRPVNEATTAARVACARIHGMPVHPGVQLNVREPPHDSCDSQPQLAPVAASTDGAIVVLAPTHMCVLGSSQTCHEAGSHDHADTVVRPLPSCTSVRQFLKSFDVLQRLLHTLVRGEGGAGFVAPFFQEPDDGDDVGVTSTVTWGGFLLVGTDPRVSELEPASFHERLVREMGVDPAAPGLIVHLLTLNEFISGLQAERLRLGAEVAANCECGECDTPTSVENAVTRHENLRRVIASAPWARQCAVRTALTVQRAATHANVCGWLGRACACRCLCLQLCARMTLTSCSRHFCWPWKRHSDARSAWSLTVRCHLRILSTPSTCTLGHARCHQSEVASASAGTLMPVVLQLTHYCASGVHVVSAPRHQLRARRSQALCQHGGTHWGAEAVARCACDVDSDEQMWQGRTVGSSNHERSRCVYT